MKKYVLLSLTFLFISIVSAEDLVLWGQDDFEDGNYILTDSRLTNGLTWDVPSGVAEIVSETELVPSLNGYSLQVGTGDLVSSLILTAPDVEIPFRMEFHDIQRYVDTPMGLRFLMQDTNNFYNLNITRDIVELHRTMNGVSTLIGSDTNLKMQHQLCSAKFVVDVAITNGAITFDLEKSEWTTYNPTVITPGSQNVQWEDTHATAVATFTNGAAGFYKEYTAESQWRVARYDNVKIYALESTVPDYGSSSGDLTQWRSGISLIPSGSNGVEYAVERWYHDPKVDDRGVIYIQDDTLITLEHNERNRVLSDADGLEENIVGIDGADGIPDSGDEGIIRFFPDMDWNFRFQWSEGLLGESIDETNKYPRYTAPFSFSSLTYYDSTNVVGSTGLSTDIATYLAQPSSVRNDEQVSYWRGCIGPDGEEWHILTVGDDDFEVLGQDHHEEWSSDGKIFYFVVNPQAPCLEFKADTAAAQFYTTPAKGYFIPKIQPQITYVSEGVSLTLKNITAPAEPMQWKLDDGAWQTYTNSIDLDTLGMADDRIGILRFRIGTRIEKTRTLHYKPSYPSDQEVHPSPMIAKNEEILDRLRSTISTNTDFSSAWASLLNRVPAEGAPRSPTGIRFGSNEKELFLPPLVMGIDAYPTLAQYAKVQTLDNLLCIDPIGHEKSHNISGPARERVRHGYYLEADILDIALNYDALIQTYRYPEYSDGYTAIEDYKVRDLLASSCMIANQWEYIYADFPNRTPHAPNTGMWDTAERIGTFMIAMMMPTYDTYYCGTSGADGTVATNHWTPFYNTSYSWFDVMDDPALGDGLYGLISTDQPPLWADRPGYFGRRMMGWMFASLMNVHFNFDGYRWLHLEQAMALAEAGTLPAGKHDEGDPLTVTRAISHEVLPLLMNENFPDRAHAVEDYLVIEQGLAEHSLEYYLYVRSPFGWFNIRPDWTNHLPRTGGFMMMLQ